MLAASYTAATNNRAASPLRRAIRLCLLICQHSVRLCSYRKVQSTTAEVSKQSEPARHGVRNLSGKRAEGVFATMVELGA